MRIEEILFYFVLLDAVIANLISFFARDWYTKNFTIMSRYLPLVQGWTVYYLVLVLWIGFALYRIGIL